MKNVMAQLFDETGIKEQGSRNKAQGARIPLTVFYIMHINL